MPAKPIFLLFLFVSFPVQSFCQTIVTSSLLGGNASGEAVTGVQIQSDGTMVLAGNLDLNSLGGNQALLLNGATTSSLGTVVRLSTNGQQVLSITKVGQRIADLNMDGLNNLYLAMEDGGAIKLNAQADSVLWAKNDKPVYRIDAGAQGYCAMLCETGVNFGGFERIRLYSPEGTLILDKKTGMRMKDLVVSEENQLIAYCGFNMYFASAQELHMTFLEAIQFNGAVQYTGYNWNDKDWVGNNWGEQTRGELIHIGQDGNLYVMHTWTGKGYNCLERDPFDRGKRIIQTTGDNWMNIQTMRTGEEGDSKKKLFLTKHDLKTGNYLKGVAYANRASQGPGSIDVRDPGGLVADRLGTVYFAGSSSANFPVPPAYTPSGSGEIAINPTGSAYAGRAVLGSIGPDFDKRPVSVSFDGRNLRNVAVRSLNGQRVILTGGIGNSTSYQWNAIQSTPAGSQDGFFSIVFSPGNLSAPGAPSSLASTTQTVKKISLQWNHAGDQEDGFLIERRTGSGNFQAIARVPENTLHFTDIHIGPGTTYTYRVAAYNLSGTSGFSDELTVSVGQPVVPASPTGLSADVLNQSQILLNWQGVPGAGGYILETSESAFNFFPLKVFDATQLTHTLTGLKAGTTHRFRIIAFNEDGNSAPSPVTEATTLMPPLYPSQSLTGLSPGLCFKVTRHAMTLGVWPDFKTMPLLRTGTVSNIHIAEARDTIRDNYDIMFRGYIQIPADGAYTFTDLSEKGAILFIDDTIVVDNSVWKWGPFQKTGIIGLKAGLHKFTYEFFFTYGRTNVQAAQAELYIEGPGLEKQLIPGSMLFRMEPCVVDGPVPQAPSHPTHQALAGNTAKICWRDNSTNESAFTVEHTPFGWNTYDAFKEMVRTDKNVPCYTFPHIIPGNNYQLRVRALNEFGYSAYTDTLFFTSTGQVDSIPAPPDELRHNLVSSNRIGILWRDNSFNENGFEAEIRSQNQADFVPAGKVTMNVNAFTFQNLVPETWYYFRVRSYNGYGSSAFSLTDSAKTVGATETGLITERKSIQIFPNPAQNTLRVKWDEGFPVQEISLVTLLGQTLSTWKIRSKDSILLSLPKTAPGLYFLKVGEEMLRLQIE